MKIVTFFQRFQKKVEFERKYTATETFGCWNLIDLMDFGDLEGIFCWNLPLTTPPPDYFLCLPLSSPIWASYSGLIFILSLFFSIIITIFINIQKISEIEDLRGKIEWKKRNFWYHFQNNDFGTLRVRKMDSL